MSSNEGVAGSWLPFLREMTRCSYERLMKASECLLVLCTCADDGTEIDKATVSHDPPSPSCHTLMVVIQLSLEGG